MPWGFVTTAHDHNFSGQTDSLGNEEKEVTWLKDPMRMLKYSY